MAEGQVNVGLTRVLLIDETPEETVKIGHGRGSLRFQTPVANTGNVYVKHDANIATTGPNMGIEMIPGTLISMNKHDDKDIDRSWYAISDTAAQVIIVSPVETS